eukprot:6458291-Amphidinium_carterae.2
METHAGEESAVECQPRSLGEAIGHLQQLLGDHPMGGNHDRMNVRSKAGKPLRCIILGAYTSQGAGVTKRTQQAAQDGILQAVMAMASFRGRRLPFSSVCITQNGQAPVHKDRNNEGPSSVIAFGQFKGGELLIQNDAGKKYIQTETEGQVRASSLQCKRCWNYFAVQKYHMVLPFTGERFSVSLYCCRNLKRLDTEDLARLAQWGFVLPQHLYENGDDPCGPSDDEVSALSNAPGIPCAFPFVTAADYACSEDMCSAEVPMSDLPSAPMPDQPSVSFRFPPGDRSALPLFAASAACIVPGSEGRSVKRTRSWNSGPPPRRASRRPLTLSQHITRVCSESSSPFGRFYQAGVVHVQNQRISAKPPDSGQEQAALFPMGFPYPQVFTPAVVPLSARRRQRYWATRRVQQFMNLMVAQWTWLSLGGPRRGLNSQMMGLPLSPMQRQCVAAQTVNVRTLCRVPLDSDASDESGAGGSKLQHLLQQLRVNRETKSYCVPQGSCPSQLPPITITLKAEGGQPCCAETCRSNRPPTTCCSQTVWCSVGRAECV